MQPVIDKNTGTMHINAKVAIDRQTTPIAIYETFGKTNVNVSDKMNGWKNYTVHNFQATGLYFTFIFYFENDNLKHLDFTISETISSATSWDNYSQKQELQLKRYYESWLNKQVGHKRTFKWGTIEASYDIKGGGSSIFLTYK